jgi:2-dehydro-3-deoxyphosphogluconate aldolase/(4S)-4-hydroxy-2-oxoglutarate aldolase
MMRAGLPEAVMASRLVGVMRGIGIDRSVDIAEAARAGGVVVFEVTMDSPGATATIEALASLGHVVGAGTVLSIDDAIGAAASGAQFLVSPHTDTGVVGWATANGHPIVPGAFTPTEIVSAWDLGAAAVKLFPASIGGPELVRAISGPLGDVPLMVTGGIDAANVASYLSAGAVAAGVGGWLVGGEDLDRVRRRSEQLVEAVRSANV